MLSSKPVDAFIKYRGLLQNYQKRIIKTYRNICFKMHALSSKAAKKPKLFLNTLLPLWCATNRKAEENTDKMRSEDNLQEQIGLILSRSTSNQRKMARLDFSAVSRVK